MLLAVTCPNLSVAQTPANICESALSGDFKYDHTDDWLKVYSEFRNRPSQMLPQNAALVHEIQSKIQSILSSDAPHAIELKPIAKTLLLDAEKILTTTQSYPAFLKLVDETASLFTRFNVNNLGEYTNHPYMETGSTRFTNDVNKRPLQFLNSSIDERMGDRAHENYLLLPVSRDLSELDFVRVFHLPIYFFGLTFQPVTFADGAPYSSNGFLGHDAFHSGVMLAGGNRNYSSGDPKLIAERIKWYPALIKELESIPDEKLKDNLVKIIFHVVHEIYKPLEYVFYEDSFVLGDRAWRLSGPEGYSSIEELEKAKPGELKLLHDKSIAWIRQFFASHADMREILNATVKSRGFSWDG